LDLIVIIIVACSRSDPESKTEGKRKGRPLIWIIDWKEEEIFGPFEVSARTG
jgi:hypothetical protein